MIGIDTLQAAVVTAVDALAAPVPDNTAEFNYLGTQYVYPCVRVRVNSLRPLYRNGTCLKMLAAFELIAFSDSPSSLEVSQITNALAAGLGNRRLTVGANKSTPLRIMEIVGPLPLTEGRRWAEHVMFECEVPTT